jgi:acyl-CoA dehydrogenase
LSFCATEAETGTDVARMETVARAVEGGYRLDGKKYFITNINYASHLVIFAKIEAPSGMRESGLSVFVLPASTPGIEVGKALRKHGQRESNTGQVRFANVVIPAENILGKPGEGLKILSTCISRTKTLISGASVGVCRRAEKDALGYLAEKNRYGEPLLAKREIQKVLSALRVRAEATWLLGCKAAAAWDENGTATLEASMAKFFGADTAMAFVNEAMELMGGTGYLQASFITKLHRDVRLFEIYEGASLVQQAMIERELYAPFLKKNRT